MKLHSLIFRLNINGNSNSSLKKNTVHQLVSLRRKPTTENYRKLELLVCMKKKFTSQNPSYRFNNTTKCEAQKNVKPVQPRHSQEKLTVC